VLVRLRECIRPEVKVTILADRGFADQKLYALLGQLVFDFVVRFRQCITVTSAEGERRTAAEWVPQQGRARMKEAWCLATSVEQASAAKVIGLYGRRFTIEEKFRDIKDLRFGMGLSSMSIAEPERRDRLLLLGVLAGALLTLLGEAGECLGMERYLKALCQPGLPPAWRHPLLGVPRGDARHPTQRADSHGAGCPLQRRQPLRLRHPHGPARLRLRHRERPGPAPWGGRCLRHVQPRRGAIVTSRMNLVRHEVNWFFGSALRVTPHFH
jgi:hypothetical protein